MYKVIPTFYYNCYVTIILIIAILNLALFKRTHRTRTISIHALVLILFFTAIIPISLTFLCTCWFIKQLIGIFLRITYGKKFVGFLTNYDALHARGAITNCTIHVLLMAECYTDVCGDDAFKSVSKTLNNNVISKKKKDRKLSSLMRYFLGYYYFLEMDKIDIADCVKKMRDFSGTENITKPNLLDTLEYYLKQPLPYDNKFLWDVHVGLQPVLWKARRDKKYYPILFRFHHSLADGVNIFDFITGVCGYKSTKTDNLVLTKQKPKYLVKVWNLITEIFLYCTFYPAVWYFFIQCRSNNLHSNIPNTRKKGGSVVIGEDDLKLHFDKVIDICKNCKTSFTSVIAAAFSKSISDYYTSRYNSAPEYFDTLILLSSKSLALRTLEPGSKTINQINFKNEYTTSYVCLPIEAENVLEYNPSSMVDRLGLVMNNFSQEQKNCLFRKMFQLTPSFFVYCYVALVIIVTILNLVLLKRTHKTRIVWIHAVIFVLFFTTITPVGLTLFGMFWIIKQLIGIFLRVKYGKKFVGFLTNYDAVHARGAITNCTIHVLLMAECCTDVCGDDVLKSVSKTLYNDVISIKKKDRKLTSLMSYFLGYYFFLELDNIDVADCVKKIREISGTENITKSDLLDTMEYYSKQPLPYDNKFLWDVHVGMQPVLWKTVDDKKYYPILFRFHHSLADGVNIFKFITGVCGYKSTKTDNLVLTKIKSNYLKQVRKSITEFGFYTLFSIFYSVVLYFFTLCRSNSLYLNVPNIRKKGGIVVIGEDELKLYFDKVIKISKSCKASFTAVLAAAFSKSISDYYISHYNSAPEYFNTLIPISSKSLVLRTLEPGSKIINEINFKNEYEASYVYLPIEPQNVLGYNPSSMVDRLV
ncbi:hypothetical protein FQR65_LT00964 [Abscondita terminalis]|nr:hypothetical protein FQR65_LT00964 [Abscondita terminalis]